MSLIDTYVSEIGRFLPRKTRKDIEAEIHSALQDLLDERSRETGNPVDDETILEILKEYGEPEKVASSYRGDRYLIGPRLYPTFERVVIAVVPVVLILGLIGLGVSLGKLQATPGGWLEAIAQGAASLFGSVITAVGMIALVFAVIERTVPEVGSRMKPMKEWDPRSLLKITPPDHIKIGSLVVEIFFTTLGLIIFNFFPNSVNIGYYPYGAWSVSFAGSTQGAAWSTTLLSQAFFSYLPALDVIWVLSIILNILLLSMNRWQTWSRWAFIGLKALTLGLAVVMLIGPSLIAVTASSLLSAGFPTTLETAGLLVSLLNQAVKLALGLTVIFSSVDIIKGLLRIFRPTIAGFAPGK